MWRAATSGCGTVRLTGPDSRWLQLADLGDSDHRGAGLVGGCEIHLGADAPVVVTIRVVEDLAYGPPLPALLDHQQRRPPRVRPDPDRVVRLEVRLQRVRPRVRVPARGPV